MRSRHVVPVALLALAAAACDAEPTESAEILELKQALPQAQAMTIDMPSGAFQVPQQATFYAFTWGTTSHVNGFVRNITNVIEDVVELPPTDTDGRSYAVWGPWTEPLSPATWRVRVDRVADGFDYTVQAWPREADEGAAVDVLTGHHSPRPGARRGEGQWRYDLSAARSVDPIAHDALGVIEVAYDLGDTRQLEVTFDEVQGRFSAQATSTLYRYTEAADRAGTFDFISNLNIDEDDPAKDRRELLQVRARWLPTGPGRADVLATHGDLPAGLQADVVECWGEAFTRTFISYDIAAFHADDGDAAACPYAERELPTFVGFDPDAFADDDLIEALPQVVDLTPEVAPVPEPVAEPAVYYTLARNTVAGLREQVSGALRIVTDVTRNPPNACDARGCLWGPWTDWETRRSFRLVMAREDGAVGYRAETKAFAADADWQVLIEGGYAPAEDGGQGAFTFDYSVFSDIVPQDASGSARVEYARMGAQAALNVRYDAVSWEGSSPLDARYFLAVGAEGGVLNLAFPFDVDEGDPQRAQVEDVAARIRWAPAGPGVADVIVTGGDLTGQAEALAVECWDAHAAQTHTDFVVRALGGEDLPETDGPGCVVTDWQAPEFPALGDEGEG
ncbi:MAG: hypothetical protein KC613_11610 [Myxococcales bacterium]|nr:hypothetical protein [Myxococcales bacterium]MCB9526319.1 hypothetical protein [Myxococcales bacterium]